MSYQKELNFAKNLALKAGAIMRKHFSLDLESTLKKDISPVTIADLEINTLVVDSVTKTFPGHAVIGEEESMGADTSEYVWICDPLDGTNPYSMSMPTSMFSLALYKNKQPVLGVTYDPYMDRLYTSIDKQGTFLSQKQIHVAKGTMKPGDNIGITFYDPYCMNFEKLLRPIIEKTIRFTMIHSFVYLSSFVANGKFKGAILPPAYIWDRAASKIILENAGGIITDEKGNLLDIYSNSTKVVIASNGDSHDELLRLVQDSLI